MMLRYLSFIFCLCLFAMPVPAQDTAMLNAADDLTELSDKFDDSTTLTNWLMLTDSEGWWDMLKTADIDTTSTDHLYIEPNTRG